MPPDSSLGRIPSDSDRDSELLKIQAKGVEDLTHEFRDALHQAARANHGLRFRLGDLDIKVPKNLIDAFYDASLHSSEIILNYFDPVSKQELAQRKEQLEKRTGKSVAIGEYDSEKLVIFLQTYRKFLDLHGEFHNSIPKEKADAIITVCKKLRDIGDSDLTIKTAAERFGVTFWKEMDDFRKEAEWLKNRKVE